jgi:hypothetical protein
MWENFQTFAVWWTLAQFGLLGFFIIIGIFTGSPFRQPEDSTSPTATLRATTATGRIGGHEHD